MLDRLIKNISLVSVNNVTPWYHTAEELTHWLTAMLVRVQEHAKFVAACKVIHIAKKFVLR